MKVSNQALGAILLMIWAGTAPWNAAQNTAFIYQGRLNNNNSPVNGAYDFQFTLHDAETAGNQVGAAESESNVSVSGGAFSAELDFGAGAFNGERRWLQIWVRPSG